MSFGGEFSPPDSWYEEPDERPEEEDEESKGDRRYHEQVEKELAS